MSRTLTAEGARANAALAHRLLDRALLITGIVMLVLFFVPWVVRPTKSVEATRLIFTWQLLKGGSLGRVIFLMWLPIAGANLLGLRFFRQVPDMLRAALAATIGIIPLAALCAMPLTFGQPPAAFPDVVGYGLLAAAPIMAFGLQHRLADADSAIARGAILVGALLVVGSLLIPNTTAEGVEAPIVFLFTHAPKSAGYAGLAIYLILPGPLALLALLGLFRGGRFNRLMRLLLFYFVRFIPGLFLLLAFPALLAQKDGVYRFYVLFVGAIITGYLSCLVTGASALLADAAHKRALRRAL